MTTLNSVLETSKMAAQRFGAGVAGVLALIAGCLLLSAFATLGLAILGIGAVVTVLTLAISALSPMKEPQAEAA
ncbi:hypothetical protein [Labrenzia sp. VG12]|uniref:hypothetical protein n=1 Tax=Labrenzia sp. VG12 TaxID=2021862 RepID=UPI000B8C3FE6|nr:hypothetical protein [Labrenzia sp. VG12]ASP34024.1 hypothetical protein CHH27_12875 [Labrenzia sp. VG12]